MFFTDESLESLLLHTLLMIKRVKLNQPITIIKEEKRLIREKQEYLWTVDFLKKLAAIFALRFPEDEVLYLTLHILGGKFRYREHVHYLSSIDLMDNNRLLLELVQSLTERMSELHSIDYELDRVLVDGLKVHLYTTLNRLHYGLAVSNPMLHEIKNMYPYMFNMVIAALEEVNNQLHFTIPEEEAGYLTLHFQAAVERYEKDQGARKKAVIICHMGIGMSQLLRTKIEKNVRLIEIKDCISKEDLKVYLEHNDVDFIITTVELPAIDIPSIVVLPLLEATEEKKLKAFIRQLDYVLPKRKKQSVFMKYTTPFLVFLQQEPENHYQLIEEMASVLHKKGYVEEEFVQTAVLREKTSSTTIGAGIAIPHGHPKFIKQSSVAIATLKKPIEWGAEKVSLVFMMAVNNEDKDDIKQLFRELSYLCEQPGRIHALVKETDVMRLMNQFNEI